MGFEGKGGVVSCEGAVRGGTKGGVTWGGEAGALKECEVICGEGVDGTLDAWRMTEGFDDWPEDGKS